MAGATSPVPRACLLVFALAWIGLAIDPVYREDWLLENSLTLVVVPIAIAAHRRRPFSDRACIQATLFGVLHTIGSHYTYSEVPAGDWLRDAAGLSRNHYDRLVHFAFGLLMLRPLRELTRIDDGRLGSRTTAWLALAQVMTGSAVYELIEWTVAAIVDPAAGTAYLGTQGDQWDAQKDMACAFLGGLLALGVEYVRRPSAVRPARGGDTGRHATA
jgi:putative membrane protein